jgi:hypothetical protein
MTAGFRVGGANDAYIVVAGTDRISIASSGAVIIPATTASSSTTTGALVVSGGVGVTGNLNVSGAINTTGVINGGTF